MAGYFSRNTWILAAILVAGLPSVTPVDYNTCSGGFGTHTCKVQYSSHCCKSGFFLSATCCRNSCSYPSGWWASGTNTCYGITNSMCCSTTALGSESCCNYASYSRTSSSSVRGYYDRSTYETCSGGGWHSNDYCTNSLSTWCCSDGFYASATCCRPSICGIGWMADTCSRTSTYCCSSSSSCCDLSAYQSEKTKTCGSGWWNRDICSRTSTYCCDSSSSCCDYSAYQSEKRQSSSVGAIVGGVIGGLFLLVIIIVVPVSVVCCCSNGTPGRVHGTNSTVVAVTASSNQVHPSQGYQQPFAGYYQPPPYGYSQPPPYNQQWGQASAPQPGPNPVEHPSLPQQ